MEYTISKEDYKDLRLGQLDVNVAQLEEKLVEKSATLLDRETEVLRLKAALARHAVSSAKQLTKDATARYATIRSQKESVVGCSLDGAIIDDVTLKVTPADQL